MTQLQEFRKYMLLAGITCVLSTFSNYSRRKGLGWLGLNLAIELPILLLTIHSHFSKKELKNILYLPAILLAIRFQLWLLEEFFFYYQDNKEIHINVMINGLIYIILMAELMLMKNIFP